MGRVDENAELGRVIAEGAESGLMSDKLAELLYIQDIGKSLAVIADSMRPTGRWIDIQYFKNDDTYYRPKCPFCSIEPKEYSNFCPNCGARMEAEA